MKKQHVVLLTEHTYLILTIYIMLYYHFDVNYVRVGGAGERCT